MRVERNLIKIVHGVWAKSENFDFGNKGYHRKGHEKRSRMANVSFVAPSSEELRRQKEI